MDFEYGHAYTVGSPEFTDNLSLLPADSSRWEGNISCVFLNGSIGMKKPKSRPDKRRRNDRSVINSENKGQLLPLYRVVGCKILIIIQLYTRINKMKERGDQKEEKESENDSEYSSQVGGTEICNY